jgi:FkbM family methyltransferase
MKYGEVLPPTVVIPSSGFWLLNDLKRNPFQLLTILKGDRVMDCGAYVGTFSAAVLEQGAESVVCFEAHPANALQLRANLIPYAARVTIREVALIAGDAQAVQLFRSGFSGAHSLLPSNTRKKFIETKATNFRRELTTLKPTVVKLDVEGAEYDLMDSLFSGDLTSVRELFLEFHPIENRDARIAHVRKYVEEEGLIVRSDRRRAFVATR